MGVTANFDLPYPENDDAADVPYDVKQLADAIELVLTAGILDSAWVDVTVSSGFVPQAGAEKPQVRKLGKLVVARGGWLAGAGNGVTAVNSSYNVGVIPAGYRPATPIVGAAGSSAGNAVCGLHVQADGIVQLRTAATLGAYYNMGGRAWFTD